MVNLERNIRNGLKIRNPPAREVEQADGSLKGVEYEFRYVRSQNLQNYSRKFIFFWSMAPLRGTNRVVFILKMRQGEIGSTCETQKLKLALAKSNGSVTTRIFSFIQGFISVRQKFRKRLLRVRSSCSGSQANSDHFSAIIIRVLQV